MESLLQLGAEEECGEEARSRVDVSAATDEGMLRLEVRDAGAAAPPSAPDLGSSVSPTFRNY
ncbi:MAG: hypothetical protein ACXV5Q_12415 [Frankiaceae bacterium]